MASPSPGIAGTPDATPGIPDAALLAKLAALSPEQKAALRRKLAASTGPQPVSPRAPVPRPSAASGPAPASYAQEAMWFLDQFEPGDTAYHRPVFWRLRGRLHPGALEAAIQEVVRRHDTLRTSFRPGTTHPLQHVEPFRPCPLSITPLPVDRDHDPEAWLAGIVREEAARPFDLATGPLFRARLVRLADADHALLLGFHHAIFDGWSATVLGDELATHYTHALRHPGLPPPLPPLTLQYADWAADQRRRMDGPALRQQLEETVRHLAGHPGMLEFPTDHPRPPHRTSRGASCSRLLSPDLTRRARAFASGNDASLFMVLATAVATLLHRHSGETDILLGVPVAGRSRLESEPLIGCCISTVVLRLDLSGNPSARTLLQRIREESLRAFAAQEIPFELLVARLSPRRDLSRTPLYQASLQLRNLPRPSVAWPDLDVSVIPVPTTTARTDLEFECTESDEGLRMVTIHAADLFQEATIERLLAHAEQLLGALLAQPDQPIGSLPMLSAEERHQLVVAWNPGATEYPRDACLHHLFEAQVRRAPDRTALTFEGSALSYAELHHRAVVLATHLRAAGAAPDLPVGLCLERSPDLIVALLAILLAGGAYLPLDPTHPADRLALVWRESRASILVTRSSLRRIAPADARVVLALDQLPAPAQPDSLPPPPDVASHHLAYVLFTSGTTGVPKGVAVEHRSVVNFLHAMLRSPGMTSGDAVLAITTLGFDIAATEILLPLVCGAQIVLASDADRTDPTAIARLVADQGVTVVQATPATWRLLQATDWPGQPGLRAFSGGEALPRDLAQWLLPRCTELWNFYGPTETTVWSTAARIRCADDIPIGRALANTRLYVVDRQQQLLPSGLPGELLIGGDGLARGYLHRPELTAERFLDDPFLPGPGHRVYRTGDLVRQRPDGQLEHLGRLDHQVKIRGFRIEPEEVEVRLAAHPALSRAAVLVVRRPSEDPWLRAFAVPADPGSPPTVVELRAFLAEHLPAYMIPARVTLLPSLPLSANGKIDRGALANLPDSPESTPSGPAPDLEPLERDIAAIWSRFLPGRPFHAESDFFENGGHSLLALRVLAVLQQELGLRLSLLDFFRHPTIAGLAGIAQPASPTASRRARNPRLLGAACGVPFFVVPGQFGLGGLRPSFVAALQDVAPFYDRLRYPGVDDALPPSETLPGIAEHLIGQIETLHPPAAGPLCLGGHSFGGVVAYEMARLLLARGRAVPALLLFDTLLPANFRRRSLPGCLVELLRRARRLPPGQRLPFITGFVGSGVAKHLRARLPRPWIPGAAPGPRPLPGDVAPAVAQVGLLNESVRAASARALATYRPGPYSGRVILFQATERLPNEGLRHEIPPCNGWSSLLTGPFEILRAPTHHLGIFTDPPAIVLERTVALLRELRNAPGSASPSGT